MRKFLVFVPAGDNSLHRKWCSPSRNFDICVNYYGDDKKIEQEYRQTSDYFFTHKGYAYEILIKILMENDFWKGYKYIQKIDDDIAISVKDLSICFELCLKHNFNLAQPSLLAKNCCYKHLINVKNSDYRYVDFVEIQMPIWKMPVFLDKIYPVLKKNSDIIKCGWGLDILMPYLINFSGMAVIDRVIANHTKPISITSWYLKMPISPFIEEVMLLRRYNVKKFFCNKEGMSNIRLKSEIVEQITNIECCK